MDIEAIERALREGPVDEPRYVPGAFRRARQRLWFATTAFVATAALVAGVVLGVMLSELRQPGGGVGGPAPDELAAELEGRWVSEVISRAEWISMATASGHDPADIDAFLLHDPIESQVQYELLFQDGRIEVFGTFDGSPSERLAGGPYRLLDNGALRCFNEIGCFITATFELSADRLSFSPIATESCDEVERLAMWAFFNAAPYTRGNAP